MRTFKDFLKVDKKQPQEFVSKAGAGEWGRPESTSKYIDDTPGTEYTNIQKIYRKLGNDRHKINYWRYYEGCDSRLCNKL
jgi:hypothetical protein